jgi:SAM-dependent methyltransferase
VTADEEHRALVARTLQIAPDLWARVVDDVRAAVAPAATGESVEQECARVLAALARAYRARSPHEAIIPDGQAAVACPACGRDAVSPSLARTPGPLVYGRCAFCSHGVLLAPREATAPYVDGRYYTRRDEAGVGYDAYSSEVAYREGKGAALVARLRSGAGSGVRNLLEVGSGFGFTRIAAQRAGLTSGGVDVNPVACDEALRRYRLPTFRGTLAEALAEPASGIAPAGWDAVLYQFVLEHVSDPVAELITARAALRPGGWLALLVPSMEALELDAFGASYRSLRADHLHLMTRASLDALLGPAGFAPVVVESHCNLHLLRGLLSEAALAHIYNTGRGPDLWVLARSVP